MFLVTEQHLQVLAQLRPQPRQFADLVEAISGVERRTLALTLRGLERDGLLRCDRSIIARDRDAYTLTKYGFELALHARAKVSMPRSYQNI